MAQLREYVWKKVGQETKLLPLNTNQAGGFDITDLSFGTADTKKIRIIPYKGLASTQDLLHITEDLLENDRRINNEKNAGHSILSDGVFNDQGANFEIEVTYDAVTTAFKSIKILKGKIKTNSTIYEIQQDVEFRLASDIPTPLTIVEDENARMVLSASIDDYVYQSDTSTMYKYNGATYDFVEVMDNPNDVYIITNIPNDNGGNIYRRDYISVVYYDTDKYVGDTKASTPYWRYSVGDHYFEIPVFKHQQKAYASNVEGELWDASLNKKDSNNNPAIYREYIIYSVSLEYFIPEGETNGRTEIDSIDMIPNIVGISDLVHFVDADMVFDSSLQLFKVGQKNRNFYHPYKTFTPLTPDYGQGESIVKEGFKTESSKYATNQLMENYIDFDNEDVSLFNYPFKMTSIENDFTMSDNIFIDHILLGYKKEGFWNGDNIVINNPSTPAIHENIYEMVNGDWSLITGTSFYGFGSWIPEVATEGQYFELQDNNIQYFNGTSWDIVDAGHATFEALIDNTKRVRFGNVLPNDAIINDYFELKGIINENNDIEEYLDVAKNFTDGLYQYNTTLGDLRWVKQTFTEGVSLSPGYTIGDFFKAYGGGELSYGWYICNTTYVDTISASHWTKIDVPYGNAFKGGIDRDAEGGIPRWNSTPYNGEFFKSDGSGTVAKGWYMYIYDQDGFENGYWQKISMHWGTTLPPVSEFTDAIYFSCDGGESEIEGPDKGLYKFVDDDWKKFVYTKDTTFPSYPNDKDHFYLEEVTGSYSIGMYRFDKGLWSEITKYVNEILEQPFSKPDDHTYIDFPFEANSGNNIEISQLTLNTDLFLYNKLYDVDTFESCFYGTGIYDGSDGLIGLFGFLVRLTKEGLSGVVASRPAGANGDYYLATDENILYKYVTDTWVIQTYNEYDYFIDPTNNAVYQFSVATWTNITTLITTHVYYLTVDTGEVKVFNATTNTIGSPITVVNTDLVLVQEGSYDDSPAQTLTLYEYDDTDPNYIIPYTYNYNYIMVDTDNVETNPYNLYEYTTSWIDSAETTNFYPINHNYKYTENAGTWTASLISTSLSVRATNTDVKEIWIFKDTLWTLYSYNINDYFYDVETDLLEKYNGTIWEEVTPSAGDNDEYIFLKTTLESKYYTGGVWTANYGSLLDGQHFICINDNTHYLFTTGTDWSEELLFTEDSYMFCDLNTGYEKLYKYDYSQGEFTVITLDTDTYVMKFTSLELTNYEGDGNTWVWSAPIINNNNTFHYSYISKKVYKYNAGWTVEGQHLFNYLPITFDITYGTYFLYFNGTNYFLYQYDVNTSGGKYEWDGYYFKSTNTNDPTKPKYGWYRYDYFAQVWVPIFASIVDEYPLYNLFDQRHVEGSGGGSLTDGTLYLYDEDQSKWNFITFPTANTILPASPNFGDYFEVSGSTDENTPDGYYRFYGGYWTFKPSTIVSSIPDLEDDITVKVSKPNIYVSDVGIENMNIIEATPLTAGSYEFKLDSYLSNRLYSGFSPKDDFTNGKKVNVLITFGNGKNQIGVVDNITWSGTGENYEEVITVSGLYYGTITTSNRLTFFNTEGMVDVANSEVTLTKKDLMSEVDEIINYIPTTDASVDVNILPTKFSNVEDFYEIKIDLNNIEIMKNSWYIVRVKSSDAVGSQPTWKNPSVLVGIDGQDTTGYLNVRYSTVTGFYPYYGELDNGDIDINTKYLVIEDISNGYSKEVQTPSLYRKEIIGFEKFKVIAQNLDNTNAEKLYVDLGNSTKQNEIYFDVLNGRIMFHPIITDLLRTNSNYNFKLSFIILNTLTGYLTSDNIIHQEPAKNEKQKLLYNKIQELESTFIKDYNTAIGRKVFKYRGKYSKLWIDPDNTSKAKLLQNDNDLTDGIGYQVNNELHPYFFCYGDPNWTGDIAEGQPIKDIYEIEAINPLPRLMEGDEFTKDFFFFNKGFAKTNDFIKLTTWFKFNGTTWNSISVTNSGDEATMLALVPANLTYFERTDKLDGENLYQYQTDTWVELTEYAFNNGQVAPSVTYTENNIMLDSIITPPAIQTNEFTFSTIGDIESRIAEHKFLGLLFEKNTNWNFTTINVDIYKKLDDPLTAVPVGSGSMSLVNIETIVNATDLPEKERYVYFNIDVALEADTEYYYHIYYVGGSGDLDKRPVIKGYDEASNAKGFMKIICLPKVGLGYTNGIIQFLNISNESISFDINKEANLINVSHDIDTLTNLPVVEGGNNPIYNIIIPVDFSNDNNWNTWNYGKCIGVDIKNGRIKFPSDISVNPSELSAEFNMNWLNSYITSKAISVSLNDNASIEDVYQIVDIYNNDIEAFIEEKIAKYSPQEVVYTSTGSAGEKFLVSFLPDDVSGGDAAVKDLMVFLDGEYQNSTTYTIVEKELEFKTIINSGLEVSIKGRDYKVLTTVSNGTITPDHFSDATQQLIQELQDIRDVDVPKLISDAKQDFSILIESAINESLIPKENVFQFDDVGGWIERYNFETEVWDKVKSSATFNILPLSWTPYNKASLMVYISGSLQSSRSFTLNNDNTITFDTNLNVADLIVIKGNVIRPAQAPTVTLEPTEYIETVLTSPKSEFVTDFLAHRAEGLLVFVGGLLQPSSSFALTHTSVKASITGNIDLSSGGTYTLDTFEISANGAAFVVITLNGMFADLSEILTEINIQIAGSALSGLVQAVADGNYIKFETIFLANNPYGTRYKVELKESDASTFLATAFGIDFSGEIIAKDYGEDGVSVITFNENINVGETVVIRGGAITEQTVPDGRIEHYHLSSTLQSRLGL